MSTKLIDITKQLKTFLRSTTSSILLQETNGISGTSIIEAHIEKRRIETDPSGMIRLHEVTGNDANCINIVHIAVAEKNRRKGLFSDFLELLEGFEFGAYLENCPEITIRIDKVMNPVLDACLPKKGYARVQSENDVHYSYQKLVWRNMDTPFKPGRQDDISPDLAAAQPLLDRDAFHISR
ncbi:MAG TPA: hypothetical protein PLI53_02935 [Geobacteraceae bacterium]|nr:hypothetical protein [Geobacteraceae bacterium]